MSIKKIPLSVKIEGYLAEIKHTLTQDELNEKLPNYSSEGNAAFDLRLAISEPLTLQPNESKVIGVGYAAWINDPNYVAYILPRSGLGSKGIVVGNLVGVIDSNYQGEIKVCVWNRSNEVKTIEPWDRVAQFIITPVVHGEINVVDNFETSTDRGEKGFNSSGTK
jgi:dUTP pyrophosphatase